jgi:hypothetical protein
MRVLTWNTALARGTSAAVAYAVDVAADVVLLQEAQPTGLWTGPLIGSPAPGRNWGSWVMVRCGILEEISIANYAGWVAGAQWRRTADGNPVYLFSIHSPTGTKGERRSSYVREATQIVSAVCEAIPSNAPVVIGGDFNFKSLGERLPSESLQCDDGEVEALQEFRTRGFSVAWRDVHPRRALPQTLRWSREPTTPFHCDGFLIRGCVTVSMKCEVICSDSEARFSDHNPVILQLPDDADIR